MHIYVSVFKPQMFASYYFSDTIQHKTLAGQNFSGFGTARKLVEKILAADHTNDSSLFELTTFGG